MLIQALAKYADTYLGDQLDDFAFEQKPVPFLIVISSNGDFLGVRETAESVNVSVKGKEKVEKRIPSMLVARSPVPRNSSVEPLVGIDGIQYLLGPALGAWTTASKLKNHQERFIAFVDRLERLAAECADEAAAACVRFYRDKVAVGTAREALLDLKPKEGALVGLAVRTLGSGGLGAAQSLVERPAIRAWWRKHFESMSGDRATDAPEAVCLLSGQRGPIALTHEKIKGAASLGGQASGVALMSFDKQAFRSYGWEQNENAPMSVDRANAYVLALNDLLRYGKHRLGRSPDIQLQTRLNINDTALLYWTDVPSDDDPVGTLLDPEDVEARSWDLAEGAGDATRMLQAPFSGSLVGRDMTQFFALSVSANGARLIVRRWIARELDEVRESINQWYADLAIADVFDGGKLAKRPGLMALARTLVAPRGAKTDEQLKGTDITTLFLRALGEGHLGLSMLHAALGRLRHCEQSDRLNPVRAGFLRVLTNDAIIQLHDEGPSMPAVLSEEIDHPAYLCGRLFAELENLQRQANDGGLNSTITDRYYSAASTNPRIALPRMLDLAQAHLRKLRRAGKGGAFANISRTIDELVERAGAGSKVFPGALSIVDQGRFAIGYHHHRADTARRIQQRKTENESASDNASNNPTENTAK